MATPSFSPSVSFRLMTSGLFFCCIFFCAGLCAQNEKKIIIHFESDSYSLSGQSKKTIDSLISVSDPNPASCKVSVVGFTDNTGDNNYNQQLSENRSRATVDYFRSKGFARTTYSGKAASNAVGDNATETGKFLNRRVEITISKESMKVDHIGGIKGGYNSTKVKAEDGAMISEPSGTTLSIPAGAFTDKNGNLVTGTVDVVYWEYRDPIDFIFGNIPMDFMAQGKSQLFNSAGMFKMLAYQGGEEVYLKQGKNIDINFAATQNIPNLNFYKFDTLNNKWIELNKITDAKGADIKPKANLIIAKQRPKVYNFYGDAHNCVMDPFQAMFFVANAGPKYAQRNGSLLNDLLLADSVKAFSYKYRCAIAVDEQKIRDNRYALDTTRNSFSVVKHQYRMKKVSSEKSQSVFEIKCLYKTDNEFAAMRGISWQYNSGNMESADDSLFKRKWDNCTMSYDPKNVSFTIELSDSAGMNKVVFENVKMIFKDKVKKKDRAQKTRNIYEAYKSSNSLYLYKLKKVEDTRTILWANNADLFADVDLLNKKLGDLPTYDLLDRDSLYCFWKSGGNFMQSDNEKNMTFEQWLGFFDQHKTDMLTRYTAIPNSDEYKVARQNEINGNVVQQNNKMNKPANAQSGNDLQGFMTIGGSESTMQKNESIATTKEVFKSLSISSLGVYNCDQISRLQGPLVNVNATYTDEKNTPLNIVLIYVVDESFNGILRYDGLSNMKPSYFPYSGSSRNTLIAFDENFVPYIFNADEFAKIDGSPGTIKHTFMMKKMSNLKEKEDLQKEMVKG